MVVRSDRDQFSSSRSWGLIGGLAGDGNTLPKGNSLYNLRWEREVRILLNVGAGSQPPAKNISGTVMAD